MQAADALVAVNDKKDKKKKEKKDKRERGEESDSSHGRSPAVASTLVATTRSSPRPALARTTSKKPKAASRAPIFIRIPGDTW